MATKRKTTKTTKAQNKQNGSNINAHWSILLFGVGILLLSLTFISGNTGWEWLRQNVIFGVFGISTYLLAPIVILIAVFVAMKKRITLLIIKCTLLAALVSGTFFVFSNINFEEENILEIITYLHSASTGKWGHGPGVLSIVFGVPVVSIIGRPGANIIIIIVLIVAAMFATKKTPADLYSASSTFFKKAHGTYVAQSGELSRRKKDAQMQKVSRIEEKKAAEMQKQSEQENAQALKLANKRTTPIDANAFACAKADKDAQISMQNRNGTGVDIDLGPDNVTTTITQPAQNVTIGPGGTFGMGAVQGTSQNGSNGFVKKDAEFGTIISRTNTMPTEIPVKNTEKAQKIMHSGKNASAQIAGVNTQQDTNENMQSDIALLAQKAANLKSHEEIVPEIINANDEDGYAFPPINLFNKQPVEDNSNIQAELTSKAKILVNTLQSFGVQTKILDMCRGPSVTRYELQPLVGVKISRITSLADDIALNLATTSVRIEAPVPGKAAVGIEVPNSVRSVVSFRSILESPEFATQTAPLTFVVGKDLSGNAIIGNLAKMPHLLIGGTTGSGKSVCTNSIIMSLLYRCSPKTLRLMLIDPKMVEFAQYNGIPHLLMPVVTEPRKAAGALGSAVAEMEKRYVLLAENGVKNIEEFNELCEIDDTLEQMPYIVIVIDEFADLMMVADKEVEDYICRIAQKARAAGMHIIAATQRPSVNFVTGRIKTNIPSRIGLSVMSQIDSRTILDTGGAEKLLGNGDMLYMPVGTNKPIRLQGAFIDTPEIRSVINYLKKNSSTDYDETMIADMEKCAVPEKSSSQDGDSDSRDSMFNTAVEVVIEAGMASTSLLQRRCKLGYARAARIIDEMEEARIIGPFEGSKPRAILITRQQWIEMTMNDPQ